MANDIGVRNRLAGLIGKRAATPEAKQTVIQFSIEGLTPLLMHNPQGMTRVNEGSATRGKNIPSREEEAETGAYRLPDGNLCVPATGVRNCILSGAKGLRINRKAASPMISGSLLQMDEYFPLVDLDGEPIREYIVDVRRAVIQRQGIMRARPRIDPPWVVVGTFRYNEVAGVEAIRNAFEEGGRSVGLLDFRIEKKGWYGSFQVLNLEIVEAD